MCLASVRWYHNSVITFLWNCFCAHPVALQHDDSDPSAMSDDEAIPGGVGKNYL